MANLVHHIRNDSKNIKPVTTLAKGMYGITEEVFLSLPCVIGRSGMEEVCPEQSLSHEEIAQLHVSAKTLRAIQKSINESQGWNGPPVMTIDSICEENIAPAAA